MHLNDTKIYDKHFLNCHVDIALYQLTLSTNELHWNAYAEMTSSIQLIFASISSKDKSFSEIGGSQIAHEIHRQHKYVQGVLGLCNFWFFEKVTSIQTQMSEITKIVDNLANPDSCR